MNVSVKLPKIHNEFDIFVTDVVTGEKEKIKAYNMVLTPQIFNFLYVNTWTGYNHDRIAVGRGSGTLDENRTTLFSEITRKVSSPVENQISFPISSKTMQIAFSETELVGETITEIGVVKHKNSGTSHFYALVTHAKLQDSEGEPLSIGPKTDTQRIEIFATVYADMTDAILAPTYGLDWDPDNTFNQSFCSFANPTFHPRQLQTRYLPSTVLKYPTISVNAAEKLCTGVVPRLLSAEGNSAHVSSASGIPNVCDVLSVSFEGYGSILFPNHSLFPPFTFEQQVIGLGDGVNKYFNFESSFFIPGTEIVKVDGATQQRNVDYIPLHHGARVALGFTDITYPNLPEGERVEAFALVDDEWVPYDYISRNARFELVAMEYYIDFKMEVIIDTLHGTGFKSGYSSGLAHSFSLTQPGEWGPETTHNYGTGGIVVPLSPPVKARYMRVRRTTTRVARLVIYGAGSIEFINIPSVNAVVTGSWQTEIPPKNTNFAYDLSLVVTV